MYAHTKKLSDGTVCPPEEWEPLFTDCQNAACPGLDACCGKCGHLDKVGRLCGRFAAEMFQEGSEEAKSAKEWGWLAGLWHDLGKFSKEFQIYLSKASDIHSDEIQERTDHATAGAQFATSKSLFGHLIATAIAGHHSGLLDARNTGACLEKRLAKEVPVTTAAPAGIIERPIPVPPSFLQAKPNDFSSAFFQRMLFSCLVDADFLATESFMNSEQKELRSALPRDCFEKAFTLLEQHIEAFGPAETNVNKARASVVEDCFLKAEEEPGFFSLTVPTGGGKTLSSLAFALKHALAHGQKRIVYVIPFTSIIEQNAKVFTDLLADLGEGIVLEHHSNLSPDDETTLSRLATENWDAPIIVTTAVQFYESFFTAKTSRARKLHNIANSVVVLDEAQAIPVQYLNPCLRTLEQLTANYHTTTVLCTATQPAIGKTPDFEIGLQDITEIISDTDALFAGLDRVNVTYRGKLDDSTIASEAAASDQALCIVNTRKHAQALFQKLPSSKENFHLSALMCPEHRLEVLETVRQRLEKALPVRLVSTQLIEAGVDIDFPTVYRSMAGLDSIAQAAGRCNRNGKFPSGTTHIFHSEHTAGETYFRETANVGHEILDLHREDPLSIEAVHAYFDKYYYQQKTKWDSKQIMEEFKCVNDPALPLLFQYRTAAENFKLIENQQIPVIIPWDEKSQSLIKRELRHDSIPLNRTLLRNLQRYTVQIYENQFGKNRHQFESVRDGRFHILICPETHYSEKFGLNLNDEANTSTTLLC